MELQRILASDTRSATEKATAIFGQDVMVISNHRVNGQTELVIAVDLDDQLSQCRTDLSAKGSSDFGVQLARSQRASTSPTGDRTQKASFHSDQDERDYLRSREIVDLVRDEFAAMRREFHLSQQTAAWQAGLNPTPELVPLFNVLAEAAMPTGLRTLLLDSIKNMPNEQAALAAIQDQLNHTLTRPMASLPQSGVHIVAGPTGSGKTLMTARIANDAITKIGARNVAIISYKDLRFGAWSQTQMLSAQIGMDCFRADDPATLRLLLDELSQRNLILIDTPGVHMSERITEVLDVCQRCYCHAILPADASSATLKRVLQTSEVRWDSLMVSKLDESSHPWPLLDFMCHNSLGISVGSDGGHITNLKHDLTTNSLLCMALSSITSAALHPTPTEVEGTVDLAGAKRVFKPSMPRGIRQSIN